MDDIKIRSILTINGRDLQLDTVIARHDLEDTMPSREPTDMFSFGDAQNRRERRLRLVDTIAASIAHSLTEAIYEAVK